MEKVPWSFNGVSVLVPFVLEPAGKEDEQGRRSVYAYPDACEERELELELQFVARRESCY